MCLTGCSDSNKPKENVPIDCTTTQCPQQRNFIIVYGDPGLATHNAGRLFQLAAQTHEREVRNNTFPGIPSFRKNVDQLIITHVSNVTALVNQLAISNVVYLAYFGHSWNANTGSGSGVLYIGQGAIPGANLTNRQGNPNDTSVDVIPANYFRSDAQVRLFGCRGGYGTDSIAAQIARHLHLPVYGYNNPGSSLFTTDSSLGHAKRCVTKKDIKTKPSNNAKNIWLIPANGTPTFTRF